MNNIKAVIMAGGFGTRLKPITDTMPKPLVPILNEPVMAHIIRHLFKCGISDAAVTLKYMPDMIKNTFGDFYEGVNLTYFTENEPMGTAGGVKACEDFLSDEFIVVSGDGLWDYDLNDAYRFHKEKGADITLITSRTPFPSLYGVVMSEPSGKIVRFAEKPSAGEIFSDKINTGIYIIKKEIMRYVPKNTVFDFSRDLFPLLMSEGKSLYSYTPDGSWCDIGSIEEYRKCNLQSKNGKYSIKGFLSEYQCAKDSVMGDDVTIGENSTVYQSVIHDGVKIGNGAKIEGSIICKDVTIGDGVSIPEGCVIGAGSTIRSGITLKENTVIQTGETVSGENIMKNIIKKGSLFSSDGIKADFYTELGIDGMCALGAAVGTYASTVGISDDGEAVCTAAAGAFACGVKCGGGKCMNFGTGFYQMANFINMYYRLDLTVFIKKTAYESGIHIIFRDKNGLKPKAKLEANIEALFFSRDIPAPADFFETENVSGCDELYRSALVNEGCELTGIKIIIGHTKGSRLLGKVFSALGAEVHEYTTPDSDNYFCIDMDEDTDTLRISESVYTALYSVDKYHARAIITSLEDKERLGTLSLSYYDVPILSEIAKERGIDVIYYLESPSSELQEDNTARKNFYANMYLNDPLFTAVKLLSLLHAKSLSLEEADRALRPFFVREDYVKIPYELRATALAKLYEENIAYQRIYGDGVIVKNQSAVSNIGASDGGFRIITEGYTASASRDIVADIIKKLNI
mgnify:CR=1 FL=1